MTKKQNKIQYRFLTEDENGKPTHLHQLKVEGEWKNLTGTSSISDVIAKPLTWWASGKAVEVLGWIKPLDSRKSTALEIVQNKRERINKAGEILQTFREMAVEAYLDLLDRAYRAHYDSLKKSATKGTNLHAELERFVKNTMNNIMPTPVYDEKIMPFITWTNENVEKFLWSEAHCFDEKLFVGGITDAGAKLKDGKTVIIDFKSAKEAYITHFMQCAGYAIQIERNGLWSADGKHQKKLKGKFDGYVVVPFGAEKVVPVISYDINSLKEGFKSAVYLYRLLNMAKINEQ